MEGRKRVRSSKETGLGGEAVEVTTEPSRMMAVGPQGGYFARRCPEKVQLDVLQPVEPLAGSDFMTMLSEAGTVFEEEVFSLLRTSFAGATEIDGRLDRDRRETTTAEVMSGGADLVIGGRLPVDIPGHRVGEPDLLLRVGSGAKSNGRWGYVAVDVKHHIVRDDADETAGDVASVLTLAPWVATGGADTSASARCHHGDLAQLAHYQRLLEACGHQADEGCWGGIIGTGRRLAWYSLDSPRWEPPPDLETPGTERWSTMATYDVAFAHRLAVLDAALRHRQDPAVALLAEPVLVSACPECPWRGWCRSQMEDAGELTLLPGLDLRRRHHHHRRGTADLHGLAGLDDRTARVLAAGVDLEDLLRRADAVGEETPITEIIPRRLRQLTNLAAEGFHTAGDLQAVAGGTLRYQAAGMNDLPAQIDRARARVGLHPAYRQRGIARLDIPRGDVEIDVDMENVAQSTYLWGVLLTERHAGKEPTVKYLPFVSWDPSGSRGELDAFDRFWSWLRHQRQAAADSGRSLRAYCYSKAAENRQMERIADQLGLRDEVDSFTRSDQWVDLYDVIRRQLVTGTRMGLKTMAPLAGFRWRGEEAGGGQSMVRFAEAVSDGDDEARSEARRWILEYNEDDVRATAVLRNWLDGDARLLPSVADCGPGLATAPAAD